MDSQLTSTGNRIHLLMMAAAVSVTLVSLLGVAAITGIIPSSHSTVAPIASAPMAMPEGSNVGASPARYVTADGKILEVVPQSQLVTPASQLGSVGTSANQPAPGGHHHPVHHSTQRYAQTTYSQPVNSYQQPYYAPQQHPVVNYINDMHPVGTGVGAVVGGLLGNQVGGGNGKKLATVAGVLMGGYAGNEIAHNRSPLPGQ